LLNDIGSKDFVSNFSLMYFAS